MLLRSIGMRRLRAGIRVRLVAVRWNRSTSSVRRVGRRILRRLWERVLVRVLVLVLVLVLGGRRGRIREGSRAKLIRTLLRRSRLVRNSFGAKTVAVKWRRIRIREATFVRFAIR